MGAAVGRPGACIQGGYSGEVGVDCLYALDRQSFGGLYTGYNHGSPNIDPFLDLSGSGDGKKCLQSGRVIPNECIGIGGKDLVSHRV